MLTTIERPRTQHDASPRATRLVHARAWRNGGIAGAAMAGFYITVVWASSGSFDHLVEQARTDWYLLVPILAGFITQVAFVSELRRRHNARQLSGASSAGTGSSTVGMIACCAHHLAELIPIVGAVGVAAFLYDWRVAFMVIGIAMNAVAVTLAYRRLRANASSETESCAA